MERVTYWVRDRQKEREREREWERERERERGQLVSEVVREQPGQKEIRQQRVKVCCCLLNSNQEQNCPGGWGRRIHLLYLCWGVRPPPNECPENDTKKSDGEVPVMLELWGMPRTPSLLSFPGPLWPGVVAPDRFLSMGKKELKYVLLLN